MLYVVDTFGVEPIAVDPISVDTCFVEPMACFGYLYADYWLLFML